MQPTFDIKNEMCRGTKQGSKCSFMISKSMKSKNLNCYEEITQVITLRELLLNLTSIVAIKIETIIKEQVA